MKCVILAAGYATRLYPLTENFPKPLLKVGSKTILDWLIDDIDSAGVVDAYVVVTNHKFAGCFREWVDERKKARESAAAGAASAGTVSDAREGVAPGAAPPVITVVDDGTSTNETRLGAVCDIQYAIDQLGLDDDLLVIAGDNVLDFSLTHFIRYAGAKGTSCTMRYWEEDDKRLRKSGVSEVGPDEVLISLEEKPAEPKSHWCTPPFYFYTRTDVRRIREAIGDGCGTDAPGSLVAWMCRHSVLHSMEMPGSRYDIGSLESYEYVQKTYKGIVK